MNPGWFDGSQGADFRFKPGHATWNKGLKGVNGKSATTFKKGDMPQTWVPIGSKRIDKDGNLTIKVADVGPRRERWQPMHRLVWIAANGPIPDGCFVVFKAGQKTAQEEQITLDRLECVNRAENMRRNSVHRLPKEIAQTIQLIGALNRQINKRKK